MVFTSGLLLLLQLLLSPLLRGRGRVLGPLLVVVEKRRLLVMVVKRRRQRRLLVVVVEKR